MTWLVSISVTFNIVHQRIGLYFSLILIIYAIFLEIPESPSNSVRWKIYTVSPIPACSFGLPATNPTNPKSSTFSEAPWSVYVLPDILIIHRHSIYWVWCCFCVSPATVSLQEPTKVRLCMYVRWEKHLCFVQPLLDLKSFKLES